ncbi:hypothetical protein [Deinococcus multiflagellatus]|uniref:Uncharacterized protein n=1 Tax=Deinococcus multiflagellatus TaxID=1656887 RepID=A0ABW1ZFJ0_9DEIO
MLARARHEVQALIYTGRAASGRGDLLGSALRAAGWHAVGVTAVPSVAHLLASLVLQLREHLPAALQAEADALLSSGAGPERDLVALCQLLLRLGQPVAFVLRGAESLTEDTARALGFMLNWPAPLLLALITTPQGERRVRAHLGSAAAPGRLITAEHPPLSPAAVAALLPPNAPRPPWRCCGSPKAGGPLPARWPPPPTWGCAAAWTRPCAPCCSPSCAPPCPTPTGWPHWRPSRRRLPRRRP